MVGFCMTKRLILLKNRDFNVFRLKKLENRKNRDFSKKSVYSLKKTRNPSTGKRVELVKNQTNLIQEFPKLLIRKASRAVE